MTLVTPSGKAFEHRTAFVADTKRFAEAMENARRKLELLRSDTRGASSRSRR